MKHNYITRILVAAVSLSAFASNSAYADEVSIYAAGSAPLTLSNFVVDSLLHTDPMTWIGVGIFVVLVAVLVGWLWGRAWNRSWKPWAAPLPCYSIATLLAIMTLLTPMYLNGSKGDASPSLLFDPISTTMQAQNEYNNIKANEGFTEDKKKEEINALIKKWNEKTKNNVENNDNKVKLFNHFRTVYKNLDSYKNDENILSHIHDSNRAYIAFMNMNIWGLLGALGCLFILVAVLSYSDIKLIEPSVKE